MPRYPNPYAVADYGRKLFDMYPGFRHTRALCLDLEGGGSGDERVLSLFWPQKQGKQRFNMIWRGEPVESLDRAGLEYALNKLDCDPAALGWVCVFSGGDPEPQEKERFELFFGDDWFPNAQWVNLHLVVRRCQLLMKAVRDHPWAYRMGNKKLAGYSLENLEYQFGIVRPVDLRSHSHRYVDGTVGEMKVLDLEQRIFSSVGDFEDMYDSIEDDYDRLRDYCEWDVRSLFQVAKAASQV